MKRKTTDRAGTTTALRWETDDTGRSGWYLTDTTAGADNTKRVRTIGPMPIETAVEMLAAENDDAKLEAPAARDRINALFNKGIELRLQQVTTRQDNDAERGKHVRTAIEQTDQESKKVRRMLASLHPIEQSEDDDGNRQMGGATIHESADVSAEAELGEGVRIGAGSTVGASQLGSDTWIGENVRLAALVQIGENVTIGDETVIGLGCRIKDHATIARKAILSHGAKVGRFASIDAEAVIGDDAEVGDWCHIQAKRQVADNAVVKAPLRTRTQPAHG